MASTTKDVRVPRSSAVGYVNTSTIRVVVGGEAKNQTFSVHEGLICSRSDFFKNAMKEPWLEAEERKVSLAEEEPDVFALYLELLYTNVIPAKESNPDEVATGCGEYTVLSQLYVMAEMLMDEKIKDIVLAAIVARSLEPYNDGLYYFPGIRCVNIIYNGTPEGSPARHLLARLYTEQNLGSLLKAEHEHIAKDFLYDLSLSLITNRPLLRDFNSMKDDLARKEKDYNKQIKTKDESIKDFKAKNKTLEAEKKALESEKEKKKKK